MVGKKTLCYNLRFINSFKNEQLIFKISLKINVCIKAGDKDEPMEEAISEEAPKEENTVKTSDQL